MESPSGGCFQGTGALCLMVFHRRGVNYVVLVNGGPTEKRILLIHTVKQAIGEELIQLNQITSLSFLYGRLPVFFFVCFLLLAIYNGRAIGRRRTRSRWGISVSPFATRCSNYPCNCHVASFAINRRPAEETRRRQKVHRVTGEQEVEVDGGERGI